MALLTKTKSKQPENSQVDETQPETIVTAPLSTEEQNKSFKVAEMTANNVDSLAAKLSDFVEAPKIPSMEEVKKKRGRKPGSKNEVKPPIENFVPKPEQQVFAGAVISGVILLTIVDAFIPWIIVTIHNKSKATTKLTAKDLQLSADIKKDLGSVADEVIKTSNIKISPATALFFSLIAAYGTAYMAVSTRKPTKTEMSVNK
jgi:hypothetical protein